jgi:hypothetical protein
LYEHLWNYAQQGAVGIRITNESGERLGLAIALKRSFSVWIRGWGLGIPIVSLFTLIAAYTTLKRNGVTSWDRDFNCVVSHDEFSYLRLFLLILMWTALLSLWVYVVSTR